MRMQINTLYESIQTSFHLTLLAGQSGLSNSASWIYLAEDIQSFSFLKGGELAITTGLFLQTGVTLDRFVRMLVLSNGSGLLISVGKYIKMEDITPGIREFCDVNHLPLFIMPWEVPLVDITQELCRLFLWGSRQEDQLSAAFQRAVGAPPVPASALRILNQFGFLTSGNYRVMAIRNLTEPTRVTSPLNSSGLRYHLFQQDGLQVLIFAETPPLSLEAVTDLVCFCDSIRLGLSDLAPSLTQLGEAYRRARFSLTVAETQKRPCVRFEETGLLQILLCTPDRTLLQSVSRRYLGPLEDYDAEHDSEYLNTLRVFLLSDGCLLDTAARLHAHRNTVVYRIRRIREILGTGLDDAALKFQLLMALYIREYLSLQP